MLGYSTSYSQLIRFFRLCNNINDFLFRAKFSYSKLVKRGYKRMLKHNLFVSCNINNIKEINDFVKASYVKFRPLTRSLECEWIKPVTPSNQCV